MTEKGSDLRIAYQQAYKCTLDLLAHQVLSAQKLTSERIFFEGLGRDYDTAYLANRLITSWLIHVYFTGDVPNILHRRIRYLDSVRLSMTWENTTLVQGLGVSL